MHCAENETQADGAGAQQPGADASAQTNAGSAGGGSETVTDAEFEEVK